MSATKPNPARPFKAVAATVVAFLGVLIAQGTELLPPLVVLILTALVAGLVTYITPAD